MRPDLDFKAFKIGRSLAEVEDGEARARLMDYFHDRLTHYVALHLMKNAQKKDPGK